MNNIGKSNKKIAAAFITTGWQVDMSYWYVLAVNITFPNLFHICYI